MMTSRYTLPIPKDRNRNMSPLPSRRVPASSCKTFLVARRLQLKPLEHVVAREAVVFAEAPDYGGERPDLQDAGGGDRLVVLAVGRRPDADVRARLPDALVAKPSERADETVGVEIAG